MQSRANVSGVRSSVTLACLIAIGAVWGQAPGERGPTTVFGPTRNMVVLASDEGEHLGRHMGTTHQGSVSYQARKMLDLSGVPEVVWGRIEAARVCVFMYAADHCHGNRTRNGLNETFDIVVNGHANTFPTGSPAGPRWQRLGADYERIGWCELPVPKDQLTRGENSIVIRKSPGTVDNDDYVYVGINDERAENRSFCSKDGGRTWRLSPLNDPGGCGEYMIRVRLLLPGYEDEPEEPLDYDLNPPVTPLAPVTDTGRILVHTTPQGFALENQHLRLGFSTRDGLRMSSLVHRAMGVDALRRHPAGQPFLIKIDGQRLHCGPGAVQVVSAEGGRARGVSCRLQYGSTGLVVVFSITLDRTAESRWNLRLENQSGRPMNVKVAFPLLAGLGWSEHPREDYYLFPLYGGLISPRGALIQGAYGGNIYLQMMCSYCPRLGGGLYARIDDIRGGYKILVLRKCNRVGPFFNDPLVGRVCGHVDPELVMRTSVPRQIGTGLAVTYVARQLMPAETWDLPESVVAVMNGDWHQAMAAYTGWFDSWSHHRPQPSRLSGRFHTDGIWSASGIWSSSFHDRDGYTSAYAQHHPHNVMEHYAWWEWDRLTPDYLQTTKALAEATAGKDWQPWPGRTTPEYLFGNCGDYGSAGYNERWGGLAAFREHLRTTRQSGALATLYVEGILADVPTRVGKRHGAQWGVKKKDGSYLWDYGMWNMCVDTPGWRRYLADTCARLVRETQCDGIRLDQFGHAGWPCYSTLHEHSFARPGHNAWVQAEAEACREVREAMDAVDATSVLMAEFPGHDVLGQYLDGCITYDYSQHLKVLRHVQPVYINLYRFAFPRCKLFDLGYTKHVLKDEHLFFNGMARFSAAYPPALDAILIKHADAFGGARIATLIPTLMRRVYVNRFVGADKALYTVLNARPETARGDLITVGEPVDLPVVNLINGQELVTRKEAAGTVISIELAPNDVACLLVRRGKATR